MLVHFGGSAIRVSSSVMLQRSVPNAFRGRVMALDVGLATLVVSLSITLYGLLLDRPGADLRVLTSILAASLVVPALIWWWAASRWPPGRPLEEAEAQPVAPRDV